jgi:hypothetical protein
MGMHIHMLDSMLARYAALRGLTRTTSPGVLPAQPFPCAAAAAVPTHFKVSLRKSLTSDVITACTQAAISRQHQTRKQTQI